jgi:hypothetical protein
MRCHSRPWQRRASAALRSKARSRPLQESVYPHSPNYALC